MVSLSDKEDYANSAPIPGRIRETGTLPVLVEPIVGTVTIRKLPKAQVFALDASGQRGARVPVASRNGAVTFKLLPKYQAQHYEVVRE
jgi:hypothetical protein